MHIIKFSVWPRINNSWLIKVIRQYYPPHQPLWSNYVNPKVAERQYVEAPYRSLSCFLSFLLFLNFFFLIPINCKGFTREWCVEHKRIIRYKVFNARHIHQLLIPAQVSYPAAHGWWLRLQQTRPWRLNQHAKITREAHLWHRIH